MMYLKFPSCIFFLDNKSCYTRIDLRYKFINKIKYQQCVLTFKWLFNKWWKCGALEKYLDFSCDAYIRMCENKKMRVDDVLDFNKFNFKIKDFYYIARNDFLSGFLVENLNVIHRYRLWDVIGHYYTS